MAERLRGPGLGRRLLQKALQVLRSDGVHEVRITVEPVT
jgi:ribosomal protein S18 acetylase RimI-like enzyme